MEQTSKASQKERQSARDKKSEMHGIAIGKTDILYNDLCYTPEQISEKLQLPEAEIQRIIKHIEQLEQMTPASPEDDQVKLDAVAKALFLMSPASILGTINKCFSTDYQVGEVEIRHLDTNFPRPSLNFDIIMADILIEIVPVKKSDDDEQPQGKIYQIEIQTRNDGTMEVRLLEYGISIGKTNAYVDEKGAKPARVKRKGWAGPVNDATVAMWGKIQ